MGCPFLCAVPGNKVAGRVHVLLCAELIRIKNQVSEMFVQSLLCFFKISLSLTDRSIKRNNYAEKRRTI